MANLGDKVVDEIILQFDQIGDLFEEFEKGLKEAKEIGVDITEAKSMFSKAKTAFEKFNDEVRAGVPTERFLEWRPGDGWEPICAALEVPVPSEPFPHVNTAAEFLETRASGPQPGNR